MKISVIRLDAGNEIIFFTNKFKVKDNLRVKINENTDQLERWLTCSLPAMSE